MAVLTRWSAVIVLALGAACATSSEPRLIHASLTIKPDSPRVEVDSALALSTDLRDENGRPISGVRVTWFTDDSAIATVDTSGLVRGHGTDTVHITADANGVQRSTVVTVRSRYRAISVASNTSYGVASVCGITVSRQLNCWGTGLGVDEPTLARVVPSLDSFSLGVGEGCSLSHSGDAFCWGTEEWGELGDGRASGAGFVAVTGGLKFSRLSVGDIFVCGLTTTSAAYCWGNNEFGNLGSGGSTSFFTSTSPRAVSGGLAFQSLAAGTAHACGIATDGTAWCWGSEYAGELGSPQVIMPGACDKVCYPFPKQVTGGRTYAEIVAGESHTCALDQAGQAWCWGENRSSQLGSVPPDSGCVFWPSGHLCSDQPLMVAQGGTRFLHLSASSHGTCGLAADSTVVCWGNGIATPTPVPGNLRFTTISAGDQVSCGVDGSGIAWCWGSNVAGALGVGPGIQSTSIPLRVGRQP